MRGRARRAGLRHALVLAAAPALSGCALQLGGHAGAGGALTRPPAHFHWANHVAAGTVVRPAAGKRSGVLLGAEFEGRSEAGVGARWTTGVYSGFALQPDRDPGSSGFELRADVGARLDDGALVARGDWYGGGTAAWVVWLWPRRAPLDVNAVQWPLSRGLELVVYGRGRVHVDHPGGGDLVHRYDAGAGLALRLRLSSDLL